MADLARQATDRHVQFWNDMHRSQWIALFAPEMTFEDPVGTPAKLGLQAVHNTWDRSFVPGRRWTLHPQQVVATEFEAAVVMLNTGHLEDKIVEVRSIEIFKVNNAGLIIHIRAFFDQPTEFSLADYFTPQTSA